MMNVFYKKKINVRRENYKKNDTDFILKNEKGRLYFEKKFT